MKKIANILIWIVSILIIIFSLAMTFIEGRLLISLDWIIYDNPVMGFVRYFSRFLISVYACLIGVAEIITIYKPIKLVSKYMIHLEIALVIIVIFVFLFATNYIGIVSFTLVTILIIIKFIKYFIGGKYESIND